MVVIVRHTLSSVASSDRKAREYTSVTIRNGEMTAPTALAAGSVGAVETRYLDLPDPRATRLRTGAAPGPGRLRDLRRRSPPGATTRSWSATRSAATRMPPASRRRRRQQSTRDGFGADDRDGEAGKALGWWDGMIGPGKAFDTDRYFVISTNLLGGCRGTTGPSSLDPATGMPYGPDFPVITVADMVQDRARVPGRARDRAARRGGRRLARRDAGVRVGDHGIPDQVDAVVAIASTHALHPQGVAWNAIAREAIMRDPAWQGRPLRRSTTSRTPAWAWHG